jgi:hypothetical protein
MAARIRTRAGSGTGIAYRTDGQLRGVTGYPMDSGNVTPA